ncbi:MAG: phosphotransferase enzyme family protein [Gammaproteobacteria bacterium]|nr:phosphotransferase enzyme family protein [Gammaproteobacteria bacterium]
METSGFEHIPGVGGSTESSEALPRHTMIGEFEIVGTIGEGGFGTVYLAIDHSLQRKVALKEYRPALLATRHGKSVMVRSQRHADAFEAGLKSFMNEARTLARFDHPSLIHVYRVWQQNNTAYMAMPLCEGKSLTMVIRENPGIATQEWITGMMFPLLEAVSTLHGSNIYHRDIAPDNVLIQETGTPMLLDFGAARQIATDKTQALTVILKPGYAPIEQFADDSSMRQGPWTDIYALGAVMYFSITGRAPPNAVARLASDPLASLTSSITEGGYSTEFLSAIDSALAIRPHERPQSIAEFRALLERVPAPPIQQGTGSGFGSAGGGIAIAPTSLSADDANGHQVTIAPARNASELALEPMQSRAVAGPEVQKSAEPPPVPSAPVTARVAEAFDAVAATVTQTARVLIERASPLLKTKRGMQTAAATAAVLVVLLAALFVRNPFQPKQDLAQDGETAANATTAMPPAPTSLSASATDAAAKAPEPIDAAARASAASAPAAPSLSPRPTSGVTTTEVPALAPVVDAGAAGNGTLSFSVKPWGEVFVDGASKGASPPLKRLNLVEGTYKIEVTNPGFTSFASEVQVTRNKSVTITHQFK